MAQILSSFDQKFTDANGAPLVGGKLYSYFAGSVTPQATYTDQTGAVPNANPTILDGSGGANIWIPNTGYKFVLQDSLGNVLKTVDQVFNIPPGSIGVNEIATGGVGNAQIADNSLTTAKYQDFSVSTAKLQVGSVTGSVIPDASIAQVKLVVQPDNATLKITSNVLAINSSGIQTANIAANAVTRPKLVSVGQQFSTSSGNFSTTSSAYVSVTNLSVSITTTGRPVMIFLQPDGTTNPAEIVASVTGNLKFSRGATDIAFAAINTSAASSNVGLGPTLLFLDTPAAGTYTYTASIARTGGTTSATVSVQYVCLVAFEL